MCGEQFDQRLQPLHAIGSPPRVRGTGLNRGILQFVDRITPACAGNSFVQGDAILKSWDHPRVCGEQGRIAA